MKFHVTLVPFKQILNTPADATANHDGILLFEQPECSCEVNVHVRWMVHGEVEQTSY